MATVRAGNLLMLATDSARGVVADGPDMASRRHCAAAEPGPSA